MLFHPVCGTLHGGAETLGVVSDPPQEAAPKHPTVLNVNVVGDRALASVEKGDVSVLVGAPAGISEEELEATLEDVPAKVEQTAEMFAGGDSR